MCTEERIFVVIVQTARALSAENNADAGRAAESLVGTSKALERARDEVDGAVGRLTRMRNLLILERDALECSANLSHTVRLAFDQMPTSSTSESTSSQVCCEQTAQRGQVNLICSSPH